MNLSLAPLHLLALFISFILVTNFYIKSCISKLKYDKMSWTFIFSKIVKSGAETIAHLLKWL